MDKDKLERLIALLSAQCDVLAELVAVARRQQQALLDGDQPGVEATTKEQDELLVELHQFETERIRLVGNDATADAGVSLEQVIADAPTEVRAELGDLREEARSLVNELTAVNETNAQLLTQELALVELYMSVLSPDGGGELYDDPAQGKRPTAGGASLAFDTRA